jgi:C-methyltransferase
VFSVPSRGWLAYLAAHQDQAATFQEAMDAKAHADITGLLTVYDFSQHARVADIGGGHGHLLNAILDQHRHVQGVLDELPEVANQVKPAERLEVVAGDFFVDPLPAVDAYMLMNVMHDWDDASGTSILQRIAATTPSTDARVLLVEAITTDSKGDHRSKVLDVMMLAITGGREPTLTEYDALLSAAGLRSYG